MSPYMLLPNICNFLFIALPYQAITDLKVLLPLFASPSYDFSLNRFAVSSYNWPIATVQYFAVSSYNWPIATVQYFTVSSYNWPIPTVPYFYLLLNVYTICPPHSDFLFPLYFKLVSDVDYGVHGVLNTHFCSAVLRQSTRIRSRVLVRVHVHVHVRTVSASNFRTSLLAH